MAEDDDAVRRVRDNVRRLRHERGMTQEQLADAADLHATAVRRIEAGSREPGVRTLVKLAAGLGVRPGRLFEDPSAF